MNLFSTSTLANKESIGVDMGYEEVRLVRMAYVSGQPKLLDYATVPFNPGVSRNSPEFSDFLKTAMTNFCGSAKKKNIWTVVSMTKATSRYLKIPNVAAKQISNAAYWTYKKEEPSFNDNEHIFTFGLIESAGHEVKDKIQIMACTALKYDIDKLKQMFQNIGFPLTGISLYPLAIQNLFISRWIEPEEHSMATVWIGRSRSRIDVFFPGGMLGLCRNIKTSERSMIESVREKIGRENYQFRNIAQQFFDGMISGNLPLDIEGADSFGEQEIFQMIKPAMDRMVRQLERTFDHYNVNICNVPISKIYLSGDVAVYSPILEYIAERCGEDIQTAEMNPFSLIGSDGKKRAPESVKERLSFVPTIGLSLSDAVLTPNFTLTYQDNEKLQRIFLIRRIVLSVFVLCAIVFTGMYYWQKATIIRKEKEISVLKQELNRVMLPADSDITRKLQTFQIKLKKQGDRIILTKDTMKLFDSGINADKVKLKASAAKYAEIAAISDILRITPTHVRLTGLNIAFQKSDAQKSDEILAVIIEGIVKGRREEFEGILNNYVAILEKSPILSKCRIVKKQADIFEEEEVLQFNLQSEVIRN